MNDKPKTNRLPYNPGVPPPPVEPPVCKDRPECRGCPYPGHGFLCQGADGTCMKTRARKYIMGKEGATE